MAVTIGVLSDTHLRKVTPEFMRIFDKYLKDKDLIIHAGDVVSVKIVDFLLQKPFKGVCGNMDPFEVKEALPAKQVFEVQGVKIGLIHGWGSPEGLEDRIITQFNSDIDVIVYGHSHRPCVKRKNGVLMFNPGTATGFCSSGYNSIGILRISNTIEPEIIKL